jgi:hypothetical protein
MCVADICARAQQSSEQRSELLYALLQPDVLTNHLNSQ